MTIKDIWAAYNLPPVKLRSLIARSHMIKIALIAVYVVGVYGAWGNAIKVILGILNTTLALLLFLGIFVSVSYHSLINGNMRCGKCGVIIMLCRQCNEAYCISCDREHRIRHII